MWKQHERIKIIISSTTTLWELILWCLEIELQLNRTCWHTPICRITIFVLHKNKKMTEGLIYLRKIQNMPKLSIQNLKPQVLTRWNPWGPGVRPVTRTLTVVGPMCNTIQWTGKLTPSNGIINNKCQKYSTSSFQQ